MINRASKFALCLLALPALVVPALCLAYLLMRGLPGLDSSFFGLSTLEQSRDTASLSNQHGIFPQIMGSVLLSALACSIAMPLALGLSLHNQLYAGRRSQSLMVHVLTTFQSIPPLVYGLCGLVVFVHLLQWGISLAAGAIVLAMIVLPVLTLNTIHALERIPTALTDSARSLGMSAGQIIWHVWRPKAWRSLLTGLFLAIARTLSETAPILFTATVFSGVIWPDSLLSPVTSLQTHIFYLAQEAVDERILAHAWSSALILVTLVVMFSVIAHFLNRHSSGNE
ncbi:MAG: ABC transporter permease subunit [Thiotrichales bacterium]|nr:ABC transporter permease subunit [Thiotrichales bacterium]